MYKIQDDLFLYRKAVHQLEDCFQDQRALLAKSETKDEFSYSTEELKIGWLRDNLILLTEALLPADFKVTLIILIFEEIEVELNVIKESDQIICERSEKLEIEFPEGVPDSAVNALGYILKVFSTEIPNITALEFLNLLETLQKSGVKVSSSLNFFLNKASVNGNIQARYDKHKCSNIYCFLFPEAMLSKFQNTTIQNLEEEYFSLNPRTFFLIFGMTGCLKGDHLMVFGSDPPSLEPISKLLATQIPDDVNKRTKETIRFREAQNLWLRPTKRFFPDFFSVEPSLTENELELNDIFKQLQAYQVLLSIIYIADYVEVNHGKESVEEWTVEFRGMGSTRLVFTLSDFFAYEDKWTSLYQLYRYSYDRFSTDKLEITQQFISIIVDSFDSLFKKASEIQEATKKVYDKNLIQEVKDYFAARQNIQEKLRIAVREISDNVIDLTRDVSSDLYKILGAVLAGVVSYIINPEIGLWAILAASLTYAVYFGLAAFYHLPTITQTNRMRILQHTNGVQSFKDILREIEIKEVIDDKNLDDATRLFEERAKWANIIYKAAFAVSILMALISIYFLITGSE